MDQPGDGRVMYAAGGNFFCDSICVDGNGAKASGVRCAFDRGPSCVGGVWEEGNGLEVVVEPF